jgi:DNA-binding NtrC family response regulator
MVLLISEDLMMSSTVSSAVRAQGGTFRFVSSVERAVVKLEGSECELLLVDLQTKELDWDGLAELIAKVPRAIAYAQHVNVDALSKAREMGFEQVLTRGQMHAGVTEVITSSR